MSRPAPIDLSDRELVGIGMTDKCAPLAENSLEAYDRMFGHLVGVEPGWAPPLLAWDRFIRIKHILKLVTCLFIIAGVIRHWSSP